MKYLNDILILMNLIINFNKFYFNGFYYYINKFDLNVETMGKF